MLLYMILPIVNFNSTTFYGERVERTSSAPASFPATVLQGKGSGGGGGVQPPNTAWVGGTAILHSFEL